MNKTRSLILRQMTELESILGVIDLNPEGVGEQAASIVQNVADRMARLGHADLFEGAEPLTVYADPMAAKVYLARCLAALQPDDDADAPLTVAEAARHLKVSAKKVYRLVKSGQLSHHRVGRSIRILPDDLDQFIRESSEEAQRPARRPRRHLTV